MHIFLQKTLLVIIPTLLFLGVVEWNTRRTTRNMIQQRSAFFYENYSSIQGICFGPSLTAKAINPAWVDYPLAVLAVKGSAPNIDVPLFYQAIKWANPKFVIFDFSYTLLNRKQNTDYVESLKLAYYFNLKSEHFKLRDLFLSRLPLHQLLRKKTQKIHYNKFGFPNSDRSTGNTFRSHNYDPVRIANDNAYQKFLSRPYSLKESIIEENKVLLLSVIETCKRRNIKIIFYSPPKYHTINSSPSAQKYLVHRQAFLDQVIDNKNVFFWNLETLGQYDPLNFNDLTHVNLRGARLVSTELNQRLRATLE